MVGNADPDRSAPPTSTRALPYFSTAHLWDDGIIDPARHPPRGRARSRSRRQRTRSGDVVRRLSDVDAERADPSVCAAQTDTGEEAPMAYKALDADEIAPTWGTFRMVRHALGGTAFGLNQIDFPPGKVGPEHDEARIGTGRGLLLHRRIGVAHDRRRGPWRCDRAATSSSRPMRDGIPQLARTGCRFCASGASRAVSTSRGRRRRSDRRFYRIAVSGTIPPAAKRSRRYGVRSKSEPPSRSSSATTRPTAGACMKP